MPSARTILASLIAVFALVLAACGTPQETGQETATSPDTAEPDEPGTPAAGGDAVAEFYRGKTITIVVASDAGGGFDTYARGIAKYMPQYIPGEPNMIVENMPGSGHLIGMNHVYNVAPKDGTTIGNADGGLALRQLVGAEGVEFDMLKMHYIGMPDDPVNMVMAVRRDAGIASFEETLGDNGKELVVGGQAPGDLQTDPGILMKEVLGANIKMVMGYEGTGGLSLAMEQGEIDGYWGSLETFEARFGDKLESGEWFVMISLNEERAENLPDVPTAYEFAETDEEKQLLRVGGTLRAYVRPYFLAPEVPEERVAALADAFLKTMEDPGFRADMEEAGRSIGPVDGETLTKVYTTFIEDTPQELADRLKEILGL